MAMSRIAVVIVTFNSAGHVGACLGALRAGPPRGACEIVVVDNASQDETVAILARDWPEVRVIQTGANLGFAAACNRGIRATSGERLLLLNPDAAVTAGAVDTLMATLDADASVAIAGPRIVDAAGRAELSFGPHIGPWSEATQKLRMVGHRRAWPLVSAWVHADGPAPGLGQRRLLGGTTKRARGSGPLRRAVLSVHRRCRLVCASAQPRIPSRLRAFGGGAPRPWRVARERRGSRHCALSP
jgi:hypothetical protein